MIAFLFSSIGRYIVIALLAIAAVFGALYWAENRGAEKAIIAVERANRDARDAADQGQQSVTECRRTWNREAGRCEP